MDNMQANMDKRGMAKRLVPGGKGNLKECSNYRTISLIVGLHASKVVLELIKGRIKLHYDREMAEEQAGFVEGTREQIVNIGIIIEKCRDKNIPLCMCLIDFAKGFD